MKKSRRTYSREFKIEAVRLLETSGKSASQIERELGIGKSNLARWKRKFSADGEQAFPGHGRLTPRQVSACPDLLRSLVISQHQRQVHLAQQHPHLPAVAIKVECSDEEAVVEGGSGA